MTRPRWQRYLGGLVLGLATISGTAGAEEVEPVDKNFSGPFAGGVGYFGQATSVGDSSPGLAYFVGADLGLGFARDTWKRFEVSAEIGTGSVEFKKKSADRASVELPLSFYTMAKFGYGYSLGSHAFAIWRVGAGPAFTKYSQTSQGRTETSVKSSAGFLGTVGLDIIAPAGENLSFYGGLHLRRLNVSIGDIKSSAGQRSLDNHYQVNMPLVNLGLRYRL